MSLRNEVIKWKNDALLTLEAARQISSLAHTRLNSTSEILSRILAPKIADALSEFDRAVKRHSLVVSLTKKTEETVAKVTEGHDKKVASILQPNVHDFDAVLATLKNVEVPAFLVRRTEADAKGVYRLTDFIATEEIADLKANIEIYLDNCQNIGGLLRETLANLVRVSHVKQACFKKLTEIFDADILRLKPMARYANTGTAPLLLKPEIDLAGTILKEIHSLGLELSSLLEMLTQHFDQCSLAQDWVSGTNADAVDVDILRSDALELPAVLREVEEIGQLVAHNERRAQALWDLKRAVLDDFLNGCRDFSSWSEQFEAKDVAGMSLMLLRAQEVYTTSPASRKSVSEDKALGICEALGVSEARDIPETLAGPETLPTLEARPKSSPVDEFARVLKELSDHYRQFRAVYQAQYLSELHYEQYVYPRKFVKLLDDFLNGTLLALEEEELERRREWLQKYGDFIPSEFQLPGENDLPRVVQVVSDGMEMLESKTVGEDEARLVKLLKRSSV